MPVMWHESYLRDASFCPDGRRIVTSTVNGVVRVWDLALANRKPDLIATDERVGEGPALRVENEGGWNVEAVGNQLRRWREEGGELVADVKTSDFEKNITRLIPNPVVDNQLAVIAREHAWLVTFEPDLKMPLPHPNLYEDKDFFISHAEFSLAGDLLVTTVRDPDLHPLYAQVWSTKNGEAFGGKLWHNDGIHQATFNSDGNLLLTSSEDKTAVIWKRTPQGFERRHLLQHGHEVYGADFSNNDQLIVTYSRDGVARVWETRTAFAVTPWIDQWWGFGIITKPRFDGHRRIILRREGGGQATFQLEPTLMGMNDLLQHAQLLTGRQYSEDVMSPLEAVPLSVEALQALWMSAPKALGTSEDSRNWHAREARYAEENGQRDAAIFHLERVREDAQQEERAAIDARINALRQGE